MSTKRGVLAGSKFNNNHSTMIQAAVPMVLAAKTYDEVTKIVLSKIDPIGVGTRRIKLIPIPAGLKLTVRGGTGLQTFYIYTSDPKLTHDKLEKVWNDYRR